MQRRGKAKGKGNHGEREKERKNLFGGGKREKKGSIKGNLDNHPGYTIWGEGE